MDMLCFFTDLILNSNPKIMDQKRCSTDFETCSRHFKNTMLSTLSSGVLPLCYMACHVLRLSLDILIAAMQDNAQRLLDAFLGANLGTASYS